MISKRIMRKAPPELRVDAASAIADLCWVAWPLSHALLIYLHPAGSSDWVFHLLLALSWGALAFTCICWLFTTDVRAEQDSDTDEVRSECQHCGRAS